MPIKFTLNIVNDKPERLDKFLAGFNFASIGQNKLSEFSRGDFIRAIKSGEITVNKSEIKPSYNLKKDDLIEINLVKISSKNKLTANSKIKFEVIFENENIIVVNKPAGLQVHPDQNEKSYTLLNGLIARYPEILDMQKEKNDFGKNIRPGIVHRLDKDTSGILLVAKNQKTFIELKKLFQKREIRKSYLAIVYGVPEKKSGIIKKPLARASNYRRQIIAGKKTGTKIRSAITKYIVSEKIGDDFSLLKVSPKTGRTHQIRVHLFSIGHPIVGDKLYKLKNIKRVSDATRQLLHAQEIEFKLFGKEYKFSAKPPRDFNEFLNSHL